MNVCTCHISELRCKNEKCQLMKNARSSFKSDIAEKIVDLLEIMKLQGFEKKDCIRALRRELNHKNELQYDVFDVMANSIWKE